MASSPKPILNIYFIHCKALALRKPLCDKLLAKLEDGFQCKAKFITQFDPADIGCMNPDALMDITPCPEPMTEFNPFIKKIDTPALSNALKHCAAIRSVVNNPSADKEWNLVLEDDVCFSEGVIKQLMEAMAKLSSTPDWDLSFLGFPAIRELVDKSAEVPKLEPVLSVHKTLPGCDSYFISKKGAEKLGKEFIKVKFDCNIHLTYLIKKLELQALVYTPSVFIEGSKLGTYVSSLNPNNLLIYNQVFREMFSLVQNTTSYSEQDIKNFGKLWELTPYKTHPDFMYIKALFMFKRQLFKEARGLFEQCFENYRKNNCIINKESVFLNNYIELCKATQ